MGVASFIWDNEKHVVNPNTPEAQAARAEMKDTIIVVDETSMVSSPDMLKLLTIAEGLGIERVGQIGDRQQLLPIDLGKSFAMMQAAGVTMARLDENSLEGVVDAGADIVENDAQASPVGIGSEPEPSPITNEPEPAPPADAGKASIKVEIVPGIYERTLPDGRIAFLADRDGPVGDRLKLACEGNAKWNLRFRNWLTDADRASTIRETILSIQREQAEAAHGAD